MNHLKIRRGHLKSSLTRFWNYVSSETSDIDQIIYRQNKIEENWEEFQQVQSQIETETIDSPEEEAEQEKYKLNLKKYTSKRSHKQIKELIQQSVNINCKYLYKRYCC